jgi:hypothetical protein
VRISVLAANLAADLAALGALGDETTADAAARLAAAMQGPVTCRLLEVLGQVAAELDATLPDASVQVRLVGDEAVLALVDTQCPSEPEEPGSGAEADARITLRLSSQLKARVEAASAREGVSVNTWIVRALGQQAQQGHSPRTGPRLTVRIARADPV